MDPKVEASVELFKSHLLDRFPNDFVSVYLCGSQLDGSCNKNSDIDIILVTDKTVPTERAKGFDEFLRAFNRDSWPQIGVDVMDARNLVSLPGHAKYARFEAGIDLFREIPLESTDETVHRFISGSIRYIHTFLRRSERRLTIPVSTLKGHDCQTLYHLKEEDFGLSTKRIISAVARMCGALIALRKGIQPRSKAESIHRFCEEIDSEFNDFVRLIHNRLSNEWSYTVPACDEGRSELWDHLHRFNRFENWFLNQIRPYMLSLMARGNDQKWFLDSIGMMEFRIHEG